ncbi:class I tRNA ligase family protein [Patescibacteria group bacterium]|nr:class I tRNA ligase family protein [Patescibacteria group bacterium]
MSDDEKQLDEKQLNLPLREEKILEMWEREKIFEKSLAKTKGKKSFVFYEGPPTANALPGIHHVEARAFKDLIPRYKTMRGFFVARKAGWDTHGLPVELAVEKELGLKNKKDIETYGIERFNEQCRASVWKYKSEWEKLTKRIGFWLDMEHPYITYDPNYMETLWWIIKEIWKKKLLYKDFKVVPWCPRCQTGLSSHELGQPGAYQKIKENSVFVMMKLLQPVGSGNGKAPEYLLVWTTTPWTLPANVAVAVNPKIEYTKWKITTQFTAQEKVRRRRTFLDSQESQYYVWSATTPPHKDFEIIELVEKVSGKSLVGLKYKPPYPESEMPYVTVAADFVEIEEGTGFVHLAPAFGDDDMQAVKKEYGDRYPILRTVNLDGTMKKGIIAQGKFVKDADAVIIDDLKKRKLLYLALMHEHDYPHCWRCNTPLLYFAKDSWWIRMSSLRNELLKNNETIHWVPEHLRDGRFGEFLKEVRDWAFSRERYWGTPLPVWECEQCRHQELIGSLDELDALAQKSGNEYFLMRHGESEAQLLGIADNSKNRFHLTDRGRKQVAASAKKLLKENIDVIVASDVKRTQETARIVADTLGVKKIVIDERIREINIGAFEGKPVIEYHRYYHSMIEKFTKRPPEGESLNDVKRRMMEFFGEAEKKYKNKKILLVSHEYPIWALAGAASGMSNEESVLWKEKRGKDFVKPAEIMKLAYRTLPYDFRGEVNLHRPYVDEFFLVCPKCRAKMRRAPEVIDVWFDSGAMPFAQAHYPFAWAQSQKSKIKNQNFGTLLYPADFISEAIDQTRGWFYTMLAVGTLLQKGAPYKNVISLGHVLDKNGQKMSKSKGNVVDPWAMIQKYGADVIRWYFYTINHPGDPKLFDEKDLLLRSRGFFGTLWNSHQLFNTYVDKFPISKFQIPDSKNILDVWVIARLEEVVAGVTKNLDEYEIMDAARLIEEFVIGDFSQWYLRRSRRRFQKPETAQEKKEAGQTTAHVLVTLAKLIAPFAPFFAEVLHQELKKKLGLKVTSVHLEEWPIAKPKIKSGNLKVLENMKMVREIVAQALKLRADAGIKVRQPLAKLKVKSVKSKVERGLLDLIKDEVNVKEVVFDDKISADVELDTHISEALREEGLIREILRNIQEMRRDFGLQPKHKIKIQFAGNKTIEAILEKWKKEIMFESGAKQFTIGGKKQFGIEREVRLDGAELWIGLDKI